MPCSWASSTAFWCASPYRYRQGDSQAMSVWLAVDDLTALARRAAGRRPESLKAERYSLFAIETVLRYSPLP